MTSSSVARVDPGDHSAAQSVDYLADWQDGRDRRWDQRRRQAECLARRLEGIEALDGTGTLGKWAARVAECCRVLRFGWVPDGPSIQAAGGLLKLRLSEAWFCHVRACPVCAWRRALAWRSRVFKALPEITADHPRARWVFLTLTVRNVPADEVGGRLQELHRAFARMSRWVVWRRAVLGWIRTSEVTYGRDGLAHPHMHVLLLVHPDYLDKAHDLYIDQPRWRELWAKAAELDYDPRVDIRPIKPNLRRGRSSLQAAVLETAKYGMKPSDLQKAPDAWLRDVLLGLRGVRLVSVGGVLRDYLRDDEPTEEEMVHLGEDAEDGEELGTVAFWWRGDGRTPRYARRLPRARDGPGSVSYLGGRGG